MQFVLWAVWLWGKIFHHHSFPTQTFAKKFVCLHATFFKHFLQKKIANKQNAATWIFGAVKRPRCFFWKAASKSWLEPNRKFPRRAAMQEGPTARGWFAWSASCGSSASHASPGVWGNVEDDDFPGVSLVETVGLQPFPPWPLTKKNRRRFFPARRWNWWIGSDHFPPTSRGVYILSGFSR